jgi:hypothetical protein
MNNLEELDGCTSHISLISTLESHVISTDLIFFVLRAP